MRRVLVALSVLWLAGPIAARAGIVITVDKSAQHLTVQVDGVTRYGWPVSTARWGYRTPNGTYRPQRMERQWFSRKYNWSPMPHAIFFNGGYAIHGSYEVSRLGRPASHGCIRLLPANAAILFDLVKHRTADTRIVVIGGGEELIARREPARVPPAVVYRPRREWTGNVPRERVVYGSRRDSRDFDDRDFRTRNSQTFEEVFDEPPRAGRSRSLRRSSHWEEWR